ncbi:MAG: FAD-binding oxidoreductase [Parachlamydiaceae bacterium]
MPQIHEKLVKQVQQAWMQEQAQDRHPSNTMRNKAYPSTAQKVRSLKRVLQVDIGKRIVWVEPRVTMEELVRSTLHYGLIPEVVPEFKGITVGGAISGAALESSSHRFGQFNDTCLEYEILTGDGNVLWASALEHPELFYGIAGSYGTLGTILSVKLKLIKSRPYVKLTYESYSKIDDLIGALSDKHTSAIAPDFLEAILYEGSHYVLIQGRMVGCSDGEKLLSLSSEESEWFYSHSQRATGSEIVPIFDYLFRHDRGAFWMGGFAADWRMSLSYLAHKISLVLGKWADYSAELLPSERIPKNPGWVFRSLFGWLMNSSRLYASLHGGSESWFEEHFVIQDFYLPGETVKTFISYAMEKYRIFPIWICPVLSTDTPQIFSPHYREKKELLFDVGLYGIPSHTRGPEAVIDLEKKAYSLKGRKMFYCYSYLPEQVFWNYYPRHDYRRLREQYHSDNMYPEITEKILR